MRLLPPFFVLLALSGCVGGAQPIDVDQFFSSLEGPKVPTVQDTLRESAQHAEKQGDFAAAAQLYQQVLERNPADKEIMLALAESYRRSGELDRALPLYDLILQKDPAMAGAKEGKALALMAKGDFDTPAALLGEVVQADPTRWKTLNALGILFTTRGMHAEAQQYFDAALKASPANPSVMNNKGLSQALDRKFDDATATLLQASSLTSEEAERKKIDLNLALVLAIAGNVGAANAIAENYFSGPELDNNRGLYAHLADNDQLARSYLNMALTQSKTFYEKAWSNLQALESAGPGSAADGSAKPVILSGAKGEEESRKTKNQGAKQ